jgi:lysyl-tRNA synthetase class 2
VSILSQFESAFEEKFYNERLEKLAQIRALGVKAGLTAAEAIYPNNFRFNTDVPQIRSAYDATSAEQLEADKPSVAIAGRLVAIRLQGKAGFAQLQQGGQRLQVYVRKDNVGEDAFELYRLLDLGDHVGVEGPLFRTRTGELTVQVQKLTFLTKAMLPLPDKHAGLGDIELRYRRRYLDLFTDTGDVAETPSGVAAASEAAGLSAPSASAADSGREDSVEVIEQSATTNLLSRPVSATSNLSSRPEPSTSNLSSRPERSAVERPAVGTISEPQLTRLPAREVFVKRASILRSIRNFFDARGYLEVETPMLHNVSGGAAARPFNTHHNALDIPLKLRIAPELYLKRLVVGGFDRVYEINRNFRNEGVSTQHNPEFTMLEFYQAYANYYDLMDLTIQLIEHVALEVNGTTEVRFNSQLIQLNAQSWTKLSMREAIIKFWPEQYGKVPTETAFGDVDKFLDVLTNMLQGAKTAFNAVPTTGDTTIERKILYDKWKATEHTWWEHAKGAPMGKSISEVFEILAEPHLIQPTIIYDFPLAVSPLSKVKPDEPDWVERFEFYIGGFEVGNAFSELNDPGDQRRRFEAQLAEKARGDDEAMEMDEDYVRALGYGLPPTAGEGIGIDRLTMLLTGSRSIRDVILFPLMRPKVEAPDPAT